MYSLDYATDNFHMSRRRLIIWLVLIYISAIGIFIADFLFSRHQGQPSVPSAASQQLQVRTQYANASQAAIRLIPHDPSKAQVMLEQAINKARSAGVLPSKVGFASDGEVALAWLYMRNKASTDQKQRTEFLRYFKKSYPEFPYEVIKSANIKDGHIEY